MLLERESELGILDDLLVGLDAAGGKVVLVRGEAGIGKSALVSEFTNAHADDAHIYFGACDDLLTPQPLGPLRDIARENQGLAESLATGDRSAVMADSLDLLTTSLRANIMVFEDTHWADDATLDVIKYLGRRIARTNGLLLLTYRDGEVDYDHPLRQVIGELPPENLVRMHLDTLSTQAVTDLVGDADLDVDEVLALTNGNPLFVTEVLASGVDGVPSSVQDSVLARSAKLSQGGRHLLDLVSVIPGGSERSLVDGIPGPTEEHMTECARQGLLRAENETVSFHHELTRRAVEAALTDPDRRRLNQQVLAELDGRGDPSRLVHHAREANDAESIIEFAPKAARKAGVAMSHREAVSHFRTLKPYLDRIAETDRANILEDWARSEFYLDNMESLDILNRAIDLQRSRGDQRGLAKSLTFAVQIYMAHGRPDAAEACSAEAIRILEIGPVSEDLALAVSQLAWLTIQRGEGARAEALADDAFTLAEETGSELAAIYALNVKGILAYIREEPGGFEIMERARQQAALAGYQYEEVAQLLSMQAVTAELREVEHAGDLAQRARDTAARYEIRTLEMFAQAQYSDVLVWKGEWASAEGAAMEALGAGRHVEVIVSWVLGELWARRGRPEAQVTLERSWSLAVASGEMGNKLPAASAQAESMWLTGEVDPSRIEDFRDLVEEGIRLEFPWPAGPLGFWLWVLGAIIEAPKGIPEPYRLVIEGHADEAAAFWEKKGIPYERGLALMHGNEKNRLEALEIFERLGASAVAAKLRKALREDGVAVPRGKGRDTRRHAAGLTARQAEVLELLDEGLTNIEIADRLFVSPRTVENHVSAVLTKLDSSTREEAVSRARDEGLFSAQA